MKSICQTVGMNNSQFAFFEFGARELILRYILGHLKAGATKIGWEIMNYLLRVALLQQSYGVVATGGSQSGASKMFPAHYKEC